MQLMLIFGILFAVVAVMFALQNSAVVTVTLGLWQFESSLAITLLLCLGIGALIAGLVTSPSLIGAKWTGSRLKKEVDELKRIDAEKSQRIALLQMELERLSPEPLPDPTEPKPYVGLKAIMTGASGDKEQ
jgi:putative membrane protein